MNSARQKAIAKGRKWYLPDQPCYYCGLRAPRYVANGRCRGCQTRHKTFWDPDAIIPRKEALARHLPQYRTGEPCKNGHRGYRYTSSRQCIQCLRER